MKVLINEIRLSDELVHITYTGVGTEIMGRVMLPIAGFNEAWINAAIKRDLAKRKDDRTLVDGLVKTYRDKEMEIIEKAV